MKNFRLFFAVSALTFLCSLNAFLVEANLAQTISAILGGTILRYQISIGAFIVFLGFGSLIYPKIAKKLTDKKILIFSTFALAFLGLASPHLMVWFDQSTNLTGSSFWHLIYYTPIILVGLITGLDLPALIFFSRSLGASSEETTLGIDYLGMFVACLCFPFLFLNLGIYQISIVNGFIALLSFFALIFIPNNKSEYSQEIHAQEKPIAKILLLSCFLLSFCSLSYELILARWLVDFFDNEIYAVTFTVGFFLLGLALGSLSYRQKKPAKQILHIEFIIILSMILLPLLFLMAATLWKIYFYTYLSKKILLLGLLAIVTWVGFWSGKELPFFMGLLEKRSERQFSILFFYNYIGALVATVTVALFLIPKFGVYISILLVIGINIASLFLLSFFFSKERRFFIAVILALSIAIAFLPQQQVQWQQIFLKSVYHDLSLQQFSLESVRNFMEVTRRIDDVLRISTPYQNIDLVRTQLPYTGVAHDDLNLYLNGQPQFSLEKIHLYHDSFSLGAISLHGKTPSNVLILGGGDGFLASKLKNIRAIKTITLIELDPEMIKLAQNHQRISQANNFVFATPDVQLIIDDAFSWMKKNTEKFDGIFIDFPYPTNYELSRLYSFEFYKLVAQHLSSDGFIIMNAPFSFQLDNPQNNNLEPAQILLNTLRAAGFHSLFPFGSIEPFLFAEKVARNIQFNYPDLEATVPNKSFVNLMPIIELQNIKPSKKINSVYFPRKVTTW